ncbi:MAG: TrkH family potassium uptake protein [Geminicoccaceae bacterium]
MSTLGEHGEAPAVGQTAVLRRIRARIMLGVLGRLTPTLIALFAVPMILAIIDDQWLFVGRLAAGGAIVVIIALIGRTISLGDDVRPHEVLAATALTFLLGTLGMTWPLMIYGLPFVDGLFEAMSGITSTGFTVVSDIEQWPWSAQITRAWLQWYGGFVILVAVIAVILEPGVAARRLGAIDVEGTTIVASMSQRARVVIVTYSLLTLLCFAMVFAAHPELVPAISLTLTAVSTGGFSVYGDSLASLPVLASAILLLFCVATAVPIDHYEYLRRRRFSLFFRDTEILLLGYLVAFGFGLMVLLGWFADGTLSWRGIYDLFFVTASAHSTAGFSTASVAELTDAQKALLIGLMVIGGAVGSTAGGIKLLRARVMMETLRTAILRTAIGPNSILVVRVGETRIHGREIEGIIGIIGLFLIAHFTSWIILTAHGLDPVDALFDIVSALSTVGLSTGVASADLADHLKLLFVLNMWLGRLEVIAVVILLSPWSWLKRN